jgi:hypothetical protein
MGFMPRAAAEKQDAATQAPEGSSTRTDGMKDAAALALFEGKKA